MSKHIARILAAFIVISPSITSAQPQTDDYQILWQCSGSTDSSEFGRYLVSAGDQNLDGFDDILITEYKENTVYLYHGGSPMDTIPDMEQKPMSILAANYWMMSLIWYYMQIQ
ncbi:MAG: FG-GAP repeat protein [FCB group bacterium]|nr:FG-GAP repeat protein [FCB group bacterium]